jgi:flavin-dependent dehydrogenase
MERRDAIVVGGGPAGSSCARALRAAGCEVLLLDRAVFPRDKTCAGWITPPALEILAIAPDEYAAGRVLQPITGFRTGVIGGPAVETRYGEVVSYGIRRREFDQYLLERCGAEVRAGVALASLRREGEDWVVNDAYRAPVVVGAGGHFCPVARMLAGPATASPVVAAQEIEFPLDDRQRSACAVRGDTPELYFCADGKGYGWCFRKGDWLNVGFGRQDAHALPAHVSGFLDWLGAEARVPLAASDRWKGHAYFLYDSAPRPLLADGVVLVGDAAGLAHPRSGEGILPAIESGILAARAIVGAAGRHTRADLEPYRASIVARFGPRARARGIADLVPEACMSLAGAKLLSNAWFTRRFLLDRWFLHRGSASRRIGG